MEEIIRAQAAFLQDDYATILSTLDEVGPCDALNMCDADADEWEFEAGVVDQDTGHSSTQFATVTIPAGAEATFHCFVPIGCQEDHAHTPNEYPNYVDPLGGWTESSESYMEDNGIERKRFFKKVTAAGAPLQYPLHHTTHKGWGYVYLVELQKAGYCPVHTPPANKIIVTVP